MNNDQIEEYLMGLKSSSREPDAIDGELEERMMNLHLSMGKKRLRSRRLAVAMALGLVFGTSFVAMGGDTAVINFVSPSTEKDEDGNPIPHDFSVGKWLHQAHDHLYKHFREFHGVKE
ncbi:MAG: hypothetical protein WCI02_10490 [Planctomycetota bacterium]